MPYSGGEPILPEVAAGHASAASSFGLHNAVQDSWCVVSLHEVARPMDTEFGGMADRAFYSTPRWKSLFPASFEDEVGSKASFFHAQWLERPWDRKRKVDATLR